MKHFSPGYANFITGDFIATDLKSSSLKVITRPVQLAPAVKQKK